jgi:hypothetical protein
MTSAQHELERSCDQAQEAALRYLARAEAAERKIMIYAAAAEHERKLAHAAQVDLAKIYGSRSWRVTLPLRMISYQVDCVRREGLSARVKAILRRVSSMMLRRVMRFLVGHGRIRAFGVLVMRGLRVYDPASRLYEKFADVHGTQGAHEEIWQPASIEQLPERAQAIYYELRRNIASDAQRRHL